MTAVERIPIDPVSDPDAWHALRKRDVTASNIGALAGVHRFKTIGELFAEKKYGLDFSTAESMVMRRGRILEPAVAVAVAEERPGWTIHKAKEYLRDPVRRIGCTPDFFYADEQGRRGVLQAKTTTKTQFQKHWGESPPPDICLQTATEMMLDDAQVGCVAVLIVDGYNFDVALFDVPRHAGAEKRICDMAENFWRDVDAGIQPKIDYKRDGALIALMYPVEVAGKTVDLRTDNRMPELLAEDERLTALVKAAEDERDVIRNEIKMKIGDAEAALVRDWRVTLKLQTRKAHSVKESSFRALRCKREAAAAA